MQIATESEFGAFTEREIKMDAMNVFKRDNLVMELIKSRRGESNAVSSHEIAAYLGSRGYKIKPRNVGTLVSKIMYERNAPICFRNTKGYYWATSRAEIERTIKDLESRRAALLTHIEHLKNFIIE